MRDKTKTPGGTQTPRATAWERRQAARQRDAARHTGERGPGNTGTRTPRGAHPGDDAGGGRASHPKGIRGVESRTATAARNHTRDAETAERGSTSGTGDTRSAAAEAGDASDAAARASAQRDAAAEREQALYAAHRARAGNVAAESLDETAEPVADAIYASPEQTEVLAKAIGSLVMTASRVPADRRTQQWGAGPDGQPAGAFWWVPPEEAIELGRCWAAVIAEFAPVNMIGGASVLTVAVLTTGMSVVPRLMTDSERAGEYRRMQEAIAAQEAARAAAAAPAAA